MKIYIKGPNVERAFTLEPSPPTVPDACFMKDDKGLPMVFLLHGKVADRYVYNQVHCVCNLERLKEYYA